MDKPKNAAEHQQTTIKLSKGTYRALKHMAVERGTALNVVVGEALDEFVKKSRLAAARR